MIPPATTPDIETVRAAQPAAATTRFKTRPIAARRIVPSTLISQTDMLLIWSDAKMSAAVTDTDTLSSRRTGIVSTSAAAVVATPAIRSQGSSVLNDSGSPKRADTHQPSSADASVRHT